MLPPSIHSKPQIPSVESFLEPSGAACLNSEKFSKFMDRNDALAPFRQEFSFPKVKNITHEIDGGENGDQDCIYMTGNSLGLLCNTSKDMVQYALKTWAEIAVEGWFEGGEAGRPSWSKMEDLKQPETNMENTMAELVGGKPIEVAVAATLTQNLNSLLLVFYQPTPARHKILMEGNAFPSDRYAIESQIQLRGYNPETSLIVMTPRAGEFCLRTEDILKIIEKEGDEIALVMFPGIQYYTGEFFQIQEITAAGHSKGCYVGWDLAHAVGNVPLSLHSWDVDFAVWCTYKYLNSGPGGIGGLFLHEKHALKKFKGSRLAGWWALDVETRFKMGDEYIPRPGAAGYSQSSMDILSLSSLLGSLQLFHKTNMATLRNKSLLLTGYLEYLLTSEIPETSLKIITPRNPELRGCQLSLFVKEETLDSVHKGLLSKGVVVDKRYPNCIRAAPIPLYTSFDDVRRFVCILKNVLIAVNEK